MFLGEEEQICLNNANFNISKNRSYSLQTKPFFQWINGDPIDDSNNSSGFSDCRNSSPMSQSFPRNIKMATSSTTISTICSRTLNARRLSMVSLNSLTSFGSTSTLAQDG